QRRRERVEQRRLAARGLHLPEDGPQRARAIEGGASGAVGARGFRASQGGSFGAVGVGLRACPSPRRPPKGRPARTAKRRAPYRPNLRITAAASGMRIVSTAAPKAAP